MDSERFEAYAAQQRTFWNVPDAEAARFERVHTDAGYDDDAWQSVAYVHASRLLGGIAIQPHWTLLDIGCGVGRLMRELRTRVKFQRAIGVDIAENMIAFAKGYLDEDEDTQLLVNDGYTLSPVATETVDYAYSVDVFIHIFDAEIAENYVREAYRVLKHGGVLRFNTRSFDASRSFALTPGGLWARFQYMSRMKSMGSHRWRRGDPAEFNGNKYTERELKALAFHAAPWRSVEIQKTRDPGAGRDMERLWCTALK